MLQYLGAYFSFKLLKKIQTSRHIIEEVPFAYRNITLEARAGIKVPSAWSCRCSQEHTRKHNPITTTLGEHLGHIQTSEHSKTVWK